MRLKNKVAIVTGAASGLGQAIANLFVLEGAKVVYSDIHDDMPANLNLDQEKAIYVKCNVLKREEVANLVKVAQETFGSLDVMVNNAGIGSLGGILEESEESWQRTIGVNLTGVFYGSQLAAQAMKEKGIKGSIINLSSILGTVGLQGAISYCVAKGGVVQLTQAAALDLAPLGIRINAIAPGFITTSMTKGVLEDDGFNQMIKNNTPLGYLGEPNDIAYAALYLASDEAKYVTGEILHVDGGWTAR
ncbi:MAG: SDR family NAD(P)-dependent oxidoreductase [Patescibacteria group bacterium]|jgi:NAD(P)-dependent dehydrogenase (short-subunit alcohol dehydrogenase family)|nr:SDR family oxidoreductase [bacterium]HQC49511.1 SDR family oxidoreductase [bacterium]